MSVGLHSFFRRDPVPKFSVLLRQLVAVWLAECTPVLTFSCTVAQKAKIRGNISKEGYLEDISKAWLDSSKYKLVAAGDEEMREWIKKII